jgi:hypothetical protein
MGLIDIYAVGKKIPLNYTIPRVDDKLSFVQFPYKASHIINTCLISFIIFSILAAITLKFSIFFVYMFFFFGIVTAVALYIYPTSIYYTQQIIDYREEMLRAVMKIATYISLGQSIEHGFIQCTKDIHGTLQLQFEDIVKKIRLKKETTLGNAWRHYIHTWNDINPEFVKALKLLQTASMSPKDEQERIIKEVLETIILAYHTQGKRFAEDLAGKAKTLIAVGVLLPIMSLMILPLISIFMPNTIKPPLIAFIYDVFFPTVLLLMALHFSANRIQVNTIRIEASPYYQITPKLVYIVSILCFIVFAVPTVVHLQTINMQTIETASREYALESVFWVWLIGVGAMGAMWIWTRMYLKRNKKIWQDVYDTENDFPHLLQIFSTYLSLNRSLESIVPEVIDDYETHGFQEHPVVKIFKEIKLKLYTTKRTIADITLKILPKICPSIKVSSAIAQIISFTTISQASASRAAKMVREQTLSIHKLDDYIRSLLSDTVSLINITTTMLAPLLSAAAVIMSLAIVMSLKFITQQLETIQTSMGVTSGAKLSLVDITQIIPPTIIEVVVGFYLISTMLILSFFSSNIKNGNDRYLTVKTINGNLLGFIIYSIILFAGYVVFKGVVFQGVLGA